jgi:hypothetical protein
MRFAQGAGGEFSVLEDFRVPESDGGPGGPVCGDAQPSHEVLSEVEQMAAVRGAGDRDRQDLLGAADRRAFGRDEGPGVSDAGVYGRPAIRRRGRGGPLRVVEAGVEGLALVQTAGQDGADGGVPGVIGGDDGRSAVGVDDLQLGDEGLVGAVDVAGAAVEAVLPPVPAVSQPGSDGVGTGREEGGDVIGAVAQPVGVDGPAGGESLIADAGTVDLRFVQAVRGDVEPGTLDRLVVGSEVLAHPGGTAFRRGVLVPAGTHGHRGPVPRREKARLDGAGPAPLGRFAIGRRPRADADNGTFAGGEWLAGPGDEEVVGSGDAAGSVGLAAAFDFDFVCLLVAGFDRGGPRQPGGAGADAEAVRQVLEAHRRGLERVQGRGLSCARAGGSWAGQPLTAPEVRPFMTFWLRKR